MSGPHAVTLVRPCSGRNVEVVQALAEASDPGSAEVSEEAIDQLVGEIDKSDGTRTLISLRSRSRASETEQLSQALARGAVELA